MIPGLYTPELKRTSLNETFAAIKGYGVTDVQFNFISVCGEELPAEIEPGLPEEIGLTAKAAGITISAVNGTFNMIHPDKSAREEGIRRFELIARSCRGLGCPMVTLCTGSRNTEHMWSWHDGNLAPEAWSDLLRTTERILPIAEHYGLILGVEPEVSNVVNTPEKARLYLDTVGSPRLKIIMDPANLFQPGDAKPENVRPILEDAFSLLGEDIIAAHGKDILAGPGTAFTSAGRGIVDFEYFTVLLRRYGYDGPIILHGIKSEAEFSPAIAHVNKILF